MKLTMRMETQLVLSEMESNVGFS